MGCDDVNCYVLDWIGISTHTSRVGCDFMLSMLRTDQLNFYSHIPCGMWQWRHCIFWLVCDFYSHIPCGMWQAAPVTDQKDMDFYSHIPCGMWREKSDGKTRKKNFYSHIPCGMWHKKQEKGLNTLKFLLTHPVWDVTQYSRCCGHWERFLLTHPVWDVTEYGCAYGTIILISTHTSRVGCDRYI